MLNNLLDAAILMLVGMVVVFGFLGLLIAGIHLIRSLSEKFAPSPTEIPAPTMVQNSQVSKKHIAAISAAVDQYRRTIK